MNQARVFIASSIEGHGIAYEIQELLDYFADCTVWDQDVFEPTSDALNDLLTVSSKSDYGIFVFSPDDILKLRNDEYKSARDNVILELGIFLGVLGRQRCFIITPRDIEDFRIPTDLAGIKPLTFKYNRNDNNLKAALGGCANQIKKSMEKHGYLSASSKIATPNVYISSRKNIEPLLVPFTDNFSIEYAKRVSEIRLLSISATSIFSPWLTDHRYRSYQNDDGKSIIFEFFREVLKNGGYIDIITNAPTSTTIQNTIKKLATSTLARDHRGVVLYATYFDIQKLLSDDSVFKNAYASGRFFHRLTDTILPYSLFNVRYKSEYKVDTFIKVDLYSSDLVSEEERRSMVFFESLVFSPIQTTD
jgi:hypothetical protein